MRRRVVVTGVGLINPMGHDVKTVWDGLQNARSGVGYTTLFDASGFPTKIAAEVKNWDIASAVPDPENWRNRGRHTRFAVGAAVQAVRGSGLLDAKLPPERIGIYLGSGEGNQEFSNFARMMTSAMVNGDFDLTEFLKTGLQV